MIEDLFLCIVGAVFSIGGLLHGPVGQKLTVAEAVFVSVGLVCIFLVIAKQEQIWPFGAKRRVSKATEAGVSGLGEVPAYTRGRNAAEVTARLRALDRRDPPTRRRRSQPAIEQPVVVVATQEVSHR